MKYRTHILTKSAPGILILVAFFAAVATLSLFKVSTTSAQTGSSQTLPAPTLSAAPSGADSVDLSWTAVSGAARYELRTWWEGAGDWQPIHEGNLGGTSFTHTDLTPGRRYHYVVAAIDGNGDRGAWSQQVEVSLAAALPPPTLTATAGVTTTVELSWTEVSGATKYLLSTWWNGADDWQAIGDGSLTGASFTHTDLTPGRTYLYIVAGLDSNEERGAWSEQVSVTIPDSDAQLAASKLSVPTVNAIGGADRITLRWGAVANADGYRLIVWDAATEDWSSIGGVLTDTSYTHSELADGTTNHYHVRAVGAAEALGAWSELASATVSAAGTTTPSPTPATTERGALVALYEATDGANWVENENWLTDEPLATWYGVVTDSSGSVTELDLSANGLRGTIPNLSALSDLSVLDLGQNALTGPIPDLSAHTELTRLDLGLNDLSGSIPDPSALTNLTILNLGANQLTGPIPDMGVLTDLTTLNLEGNGLTGEIPDLSALSNLTHLYLGHNQLTGEIPDPGTLSNLKTLVLSHNLLTGPIPDLDALTGLIRLDLHSNLLAGEIPDLGGLTELTWLDLHSNQLTGAIPDVSALTYLSRLSLHSNQLSGTILGLNLGTELTWLIVSDNELSGPVTDLSALAKLRWLELSGNLFCLPSGADLTSSAQSVTEHLNSLDLSACTETELSATPAAPQELTATATEGQVTLTWEAAANAASYDLWAWDSINRQWGAIGGALAGQTYSHSVMTDGRNYYYQVRARDADGERGPWSKRVHTIVAPGQFPPPSPSLGLHIFYQKYLEAHGVVVTAPSEVSDDKMVQARAIISGMLSGKPDLLESLPANTIRIAIFKENDGGEQLIQLPEFRLIPEDREGFTIWTPGGWVAGIGEDDDRCDLIIHEFAHLVRTGIEAQAGGPDFSSRLGALYEAAMGAGLWQGLDASASVRDYWAEVVTFWFQETLPDSLAANDSKLKDYDPEIAKLIEETFGEASVPADCKP